MSGRFHVTWQVILGIGSVVALGAVLIGAYNWMDGRYVKAGSGQNQSSFTVNGIPIGTIVAFGGTSEKIPSGWLPCDGTSRLQGDFKDLFKIIGHQFDPDLVRTKEFGLPNLSGRTPIGSGKGLLEKANDQDIYLSPRKIGEMIGRETHALTIEEMPRHSHEQATHAADGSDLEAPKEPGHVDFIKAPKTNDTGGNQPHNNMQPSLVVNFIIKAK